MSYTLVLGDCREAMAAMAAGSVDAVVTDPPYGTQELGGGYGRRQNYGGRTGRLILGDVDLSTFADALPGMVRCLKADAWLVAFCAPRKRPLVDALLTDAGLEHFGEVVWDKATPGLGYSIRYAHETAVVYCKGDPSTPTEALLSVLRCPTLVRHNPKERHPHEKPVQVMQELVRWVCPIGGTVLDPFMGTGATGIAAVGTGRHFIGCEIDPEYMEAARLRIGNAQPSLFSATPEDAA